MQLDVVISAQQPFPVAVWANRECVEDILEEVNVLVSGITRAPKRQEGEKTHNQRDRRVRRRIIKETGG
jgi:hypothetical protein